MKETYRPEDFATNNAPARPIGIETEYWIQPDCLMKNIYFYNI